MYNNTPKTTIASALTWALRIAHNKGTPFTTKAVQDVLIALHEEPYPDHLHTGVNTTIRKVLILQDKILDLKKGQVTLIQDCIDTLKDYNQNLPRKLRKRNPPCQ